MQSEKWISGVLFLILFVSGVSAAAEIELNEEIRSALKLLGIAEKNIRTTPIDGLYELRAGTKIYYLSKTGKYLLAGNIIDLETRDNLTELRRGSLRAAAIDAVGADQMIGFKSKNPKHAVSVFTDIDCSYCRRLHAQMQQYNDLGISINYLFYPRSGPDTSSFDKAVSVWCSKDRNKALTQAKLGRSLPRASCKNPVAAHFELGNEMGINGTPAIVTESGELLAGYVPPAALKKLLDESRREQAVSARAEKK